jgi:hypothetical protein
MCCNHRPFFLSPSLPRCGPVGQVALQQTAMQVASARQVRRTQADLIGTRHDLRAKRALGMWELDRVTGKVTGDLIYKWLNSMVYGRYNELVHCYSFHGLYKPTFLPGGPSWCGKHAVSVIRGENRKVHRRQPELQLKASTFFSLMKTRYNLCKPMGWKHVWNMKSATSVVSNRHFNGDLGLERKMLSFGICSYSVGHEAPFPSICLLVYGWSDCVCIYIYM